MLHHDDMLYPIVSFVLYLGIRLLFAEKVAIIIM